jgi:hypothetical protein
VSAAGGHWVQAAIAAVVLVEGALLAADAWRGRLPPDKDPPIYREEQVDVIRREGGPRPTP